MSVSWIVVAVIHCLLQNFNFAAKVAEMEGRLEVGMTLVPHSGSLGAVCLDGSPPAYHLHRGVGAGVNNWLLQFEGGGWCTDIKSCLERSRTKHGSSRYMNRLEVFSGILSNDPNMNPDFYSWNRVKLRYCDGASFTGDSEFRNDTTTLYFRGQRIWNAMIVDLLSKGLTRAKKVLLSGCSAGGLATFHHCDDLAKFLPESATLKCMSDAGFFLDVKDISGNYRGRMDFNSTSILQNVQKNLNKNCMASHVDPNQCFFPQYVLPYIKTSYFILNSAYDVYQFHHIFVPPSADPYNHWYHCKMNPAACTPSQLTTLQGYRNEMLAALRSFGEQRSSGMFINSCFSHGQSELQDSWFSSNSSRVDNKTIAKVVGDWYFEREVAKEVDCPYPCDSTCHNLIPMLKNSSPGEG